MSKITTNEDLIKDLMNYSPYGALCQAFIMQALRDYAQHVIDNSEELLKNDNSMVSNKAWVGTAKDIADRMDKFFKS
jgi:hypothetical protein